MQSDSLARSPTGPKRSDWRNQLRQAFREPGALLSYLDLPADEEAETSGFPMLVPMALARRMETGNRQDPLLLQVLPDRRENDSVAGFSSDPVGDTASRASRGVLHKYHGRALLVATGACAVHCRYCFRQAFPYATEHAAAGQWQDALAYIAGRADLEEVILSGGDPLMLPTRRLEQLTTALARIPHIRRLRIHTRLPVVLPDRVDEHLLRWLANLPWPVVIVIHANHAREFDESVDAALSRLRRVDAHVLNQAVLLAGINDDANVLAELARRGFDAGALPYYLHLLDRVEGAARFDIRAADAVTLMERLRQELSGYLVPKLVREQAGAPYKLPIL